MDGRLIPLTNALSTVVGPFLDNALLRPLALYWTAFVYHFFLANETAMLSTSLPVVLNLASENGLSTLATGMIWTFAAGGKIFIYQSSVSIVGYSFGYFEAKDLLKVGLVLSAVESLIMAALVLFYWPLIGLAG